MSNNKHHRTYPSQLSEMWKWISDRRAQAHRAVQIRPEILQSCVGRYRLNATRVLTITMDSGRLYVDTPRGFKSELFARSNSLFFLKTQDLEVNFVRNRAREVIELSIQTGNNRLTAVRIP